MAVPGNIELSITTPSLLFPTISLLLLAYTSRSVALTTLVRDLHSQYLSQKAPKLLAQIQRLKRQVRMIRNMQACAICGGFLCILSMTSVYFGSQEAARWLFAGSLFLLAISFGISLAETALLGSALNLQLEDMEQSEREHTHPPSLLKKLR